MEQIFISEAHEKCSSESWHRVSAVVAGASRSRARAEPVLSTAKECPRHSKTPSPTEGVWYQPGHVSATSLGLEA
jgi:hypothetical protein